MNTLLIPLIFIPIIEIYLLIEIGSKIGAFTTIFLILSTALLGIWYAKYEGLNTLRSGIFSVIKNEIPLYEIISGAALAFAALLLIIPGFLTDLFGLLIIFPFTRKFLLSKFTKNYTPKNQNKNFIDGESEDLDEKKWDWKKI